MKTTHALIPILLFVFGCSASPGEESGSVKLGAIALSGTNGNDSPEKTEEKPQSETPVIKFEEDSYNFGEVKFEQPARHKFVFTNTGDTDLIIDTVKPSCSCTAPDWSREAIPPGGQGFVTAEFNSKKAGVFRKSVSVITNADPKVTVLTITGEVLPGAE